MGELSKRMMVTGGNVTGIADQLEREELVLRVPDPQDGRAVLVAATEAGRTLVAEGRERLRRLLGSSAVPLDAAEREQLVDLLQRLNAALEDDPA
jgi:DNA-binding MarR family transcriptional regulator